MINRYTLNLYLLRIFCKYFILTSTILLGLLFISNAFDILQKFKSISISPEQFWQLIILKLPYIFNEVSTLIGFFSTLLFLRYLVRNNEVIIILGSGVPIWQIFMVPIIATFIFGILIMAIISPLGTYGLKEYQLLEKDINNIPRDDITISTAGIFVFEKYQNVNRIIRIGSIDTSENLLNNVNLMVVDSSKQFLKRIDAEKVYLQNDKLEFIKPQIFTASRTEKLDSIELSTNLTINGLVQHFIPPEMIYIWGLKSTIDKFEKSGLPITMYQIYYYKQVLKPIIMATMVLLACWFISIGIRDNSNTKMLMYSVLIGVGSYFILEIMIRILAFSRFSPLFSTILPIAFIILISNFVILHFQEA